MEWIKIEKENMPKHYVLAANFDPTSKDYKMKSIGSVFRKKKGPGFECVDEFRVFTCTHFFDVDKFDIEP